MGRRAEEAADAVRRRPDGVVEAEHRPRHRLAALADDRPLGDREARLARRHARRRVGALQRAHLPEAELRGELLAARHVERLALDAHVRVRREDRLPPVLVPPLRALVGERAAVRVHHVPLHRRRRRRRLVEEGDQRERVGLERHPRAGRERRRPRDVERELRPVEGRRRRLLGELLRILQPAVAARRRELRERGEHRPQSAHATPSGRPPRPAGGAALAEHGERPPASR